MKITLIVSLLVLACFPCSAGELGERPITDARSETVYNDNVWAMIGIFTPLQTSSDRKSVTGVKINLPYGRAADSYGLDIGIVQHIRGSFTGVQYGVVSVVTDVFTGAQFSDANICVGDFIGFQAAWYNSVRGEGYGFSLGAVNKVRKFNGAQFGIVNIAHDFNGVQIGLVNIIGASSLPVFPIINMKF